MKKLALFFIAASIFVACTNEKKDTTASGDAKVDTLTYKYDSVKVYSKYVIKEDKNTDTAKASIKYPIFENKDLNTYINRQVLDYFSKEDQAVSSYQDIVNSFIKGYDSFYTENKDTHQWWFLQIDIKVLRQTSNYIAMQYMHSDYAGGAHGITNISYINYNPKTNQPITLDSLIDASQKPKLLSIAEGIFRKNEKLSATAPLADKYFFDKGIFALAQNFYVSDKGLVFLYNPYEIKAYVFGTTELIVPFSALKEIAKPHTILTSTN
ncbi:DUF3298 and DUF4163 domain-containing protein [Pedobacter sp. Hv1]|uniref:DUF3298 and DUF4163 domain-containing protein n=1 Tax=Pedobacter sp. Hv1 TaxID=1740090 RepID=UPI0006D892CE|nr:DUF3298 and DUF4163 domain-containing protein [Pedobacter sp. Hv1]KQC01228.1 hypothetical protein AQF98_11255 [Pedobacter sp. Hv1]